MSMCPCPEQAKIPIGLYPVYKNVKDRILYYNPSPVKQKIPKLIEDDNSDMTVDGEEELAKGDEEFVCDLRDSEAQSLQNTLQYPRTVMAMMRHNLSPEIVADIVNSAGFDTGSITIEDTSKGGVCNIPGTKTSLLFFSVTPRQTFLSK